MADPAGPAVLFWFYRDPELCLDRLRLLRRLNPDSAVYGLYGGVPEDAAVFEARLGPLLDDFYYHCGDQDARWKWLHGDLLIREWYVRRGRDLPWRAVMILQWDMLLLARLRRLLPDVREEDVVLSGLRPVREVEPWWAWVAGAERERFERFLEELREHRGYTGEAWCCQFVFACLGRAFLEEYARVERPELGFLEYRVPTYARAFGMRTLPAPVSCWWEGDPHGESLPEWRRVLSARRQSVRTRHVLRSWLRGDARVVHPYRQPFPSDVGGAVALLARSVAGRWRREARPRREGA